MKNYYQRMRELREDNEFKQETIARYLGVSQTYYSRYELGKVPLPLENLYYYANFITYQLITYSALQMK